MVKILVVDDSMLTRAILVKHLSEAGYTVVEAVDGKKGLEAFELQRPDLVLTDLMMPEMGGIELAQEIRKRSKNVPIILQSVEFDKDTKTKSQKAGINDYLFKNFEKKELLKKVMELTKA
jgi:CheY-like chemotaxis protein